MGTTQIAKAASERGVSTTFPPSRVSTLVVIAFAAVYVVWGSTYLAIRIGLESFPPLLLAGLRHLIAGLILYPFFRRQSGSLPTALNWRTTLVTGFLLLFVGNGGVSWSEQIVPSGVTALLVAMVSLWLVTVDWLRPGGNKPAPKVVLGLLLGFAGLAILVGPAQLGGSGRVDLRGAGILVFASLAWACGSLYAKHGKMPSSPMLGVAMQSLSGGTILLVVGALLGEFRHFHLTAVSLRSWLALAYLIAFGSGIGFSAYIYILHKSTPARVGTYAFVNPVVALFLGWLIVGESITLRTVLAAAVILTAVILVITAPHRVPERTPEPVPAPGEV
ncbi:MAG TPA: EamA family transporter [Methylomirabilota bacterium]|nr:EamA family transporter [Methylomirabilota bacterium]